MFTGGGETNRKGSWKLNSAIGIRKILRGGVVTFASEMFAPAAGD